MGYTITVILVGLPSFTLVEDIYPLEGSFSTFQEAFDIGTAHIESLGRPPGGVLIQIQDAAGKVVTRETGQPA